ncbi:MAG: heterodisulfide reductase-related iron-sulfur binding cluster [Methanomassiliicoccales archaeon]
MKERIGSEVAQCTNCRLCSDSCPAGVDLERVVTLHRYLEGERGSHGSMFLTLGPMVRPGSWEYEEGETDEGSDIVFFPGCGPMFDSAFKMVGESPYGDYSAMARERKYSNIGQAALKLMNLAGVKPRMLTMCCGHDQYYAGQLDQAESMGNRLKEEVGDATLIVTPCAECRHMLRDIHGLPAVHLSEFLVQRKDDLDLGDTGLKVMYHDPCRLGRHSGVYEEPRELIGSVAELVEFERNREEARCCGVSAWMNCNSLSKEQRERKMEEFESSGADYLVVSCPKCAMHLDCLYHEHGDGGRSREGPNILDLSELLALAAGLHSLGEMSMERYRSTGARSGPVSPVEEGNPEKHMDEELRDTLFSCSTCFHCTSICESSHDTPHLIEDLRSHLVERGMNPEKHRIMRERVSSTGNPFGEEEGYSDVHEGADLVYFPGCTSVYRMESMYDATREILEALGIAYTVPEGLVCCGSPLMRAGYDAGDVKERNLRLLKGKVTVSCAGCHAALAGDYQGVDVEHVVEILAREVHRLPMKELNMKVAYHDPCHLGREFGIYDEPRKVIEAIPGVELVEFQENRENSQCCGGGGGLRSWNREKSEEMGRERMRSAEEMGVDAVVSACPFCKLNLQSVSDMEVLDIVELLSRAMDRPDEP